MNKQLTAFFIITGIFLLAMKDSASFIHTLLHYFPDNPWHQHTPVARQRINPMEIHKHLQRAHSHTHGHTHTHTHDLMDHIHADDDAHPAESVPLKLSLKIDLFIQLHPDFPVQNIHAPFTSAHYSLYTFSRSTHSLSPPFQPPQPA